MPVKWEKYLLILQTRSGECFKINLMEHTVGMQNIKKKNIYYLTYCLSQVTA